MQTCKILERERVIPSEQMADLRRMVRFRGLVVHGYLRRDDAVIGEIALQHLDDFTAFVQAVRSHLKGSATGGPS